MLFGIFGNATVSPGVLAIIPTGAVLFYASDLFIETGSPTGDKKELSAMPGKGLRDMEKEAILKTLEEANGNRSHVARMLGISVRTLRNKLKEYGYPKKENFSGSENFS